MGNVIPQIPQAFYGKVTINRKKAPVGTRIEGLIGGVMYPILGNPTYTKKVGVYGCSHLAGPDEGMDLVIQGGCQASEMIYIVEGALITFYVNGMRTNMTYPFEVGEVTEVNLNVTIK